MNEDNPKNWSKSVEHPSDDELLCFIDGELAPKRADSLRSHLEACWHCRNRAEKFQSAISLFVDYRSQVLQPMIEVPNSWGGFQSKLQTSVAEPAPTSLWEKLFAALNRFRSLLPEVDLRTVRLTAISSITLILAFAGIYFILLTTPTVVSAEELISLAAESRGKELKAADQPVLYQQLRVTRRGSGGERITNVEIWQDVEGARLRQVVLPDEQIGEPESLADLEQVLKANKYEPPPMSIINFRAWRAGLAEKRDTVERIEDQGVPILRLQTEVLNAEDIVQIISSTILLRAADYHPVEQHFRVRTADGEQTFELRETSFAVMSLNSLNPGFFADSIPMVVSARPEPSKSESPQESPAAEVKASEPTASEVSGNIATADLEVKVLDLLHKAGADLGEQIEVRRMPNGPVVISGVVDTPERKDQILAALKEVTGNSAVQIRIMTVAEALAQQKSTTAQPGPSVETFQVEGDTFPAEGDLRKYFANQGGDANAAAKNFASRAVARSSRAMNYLYAMKRLKAQISAAELQELSPEARAKWVNVIRSHARSYRNEVAGLKRELQPVFGVAAGAGEGEGVGSDAELLRAIDQLFSAGSGTNQTIRAAFTISASGTNAIRTVQFWRLLNQAESIAEAIERAK